MLLYEQVNYTLLFKKKKTNNSSSNSTCNVSNNTTYTYMYITLKYIITTITLITTTIYYNSIYCYYYILQHITMYFNMDTCSFFIIRKSRIRYQNIITYNLQSFIFKKAFMNLYSWRKYPRITLLPHYWSLKLSWNKTLKNEI